MKSPKPTHEIRISAVRRRPTWAKLFVLAVVTNTLGMVVASVTARLLRQIPDTEAVEQGLRLGYFAALILVALADALLLDELLFAGAFRRTHLSRQGAPPAPDSDEALAAQAAGLQRSHMTYPVLALLAGTLTHQAYKPITRDVESYYEHVGRFLGQLHRGDAPTKIAAISALSVRRSPQIVPALAAEVRAAGTAAPWAAWALGRHIDVKRHRPLIMPLLDVAQTQDPQLRREAAVALGRLQQRSMAPHIQAELAADLAAYQSTQIPIDPRLLYALGSVQVLSSVPILREVLDRGDPEAQALAAWALAQHRDQQGGEFVAQILEERLTTAGVELRCALVHALGIFAHERSNLALLAAFDDSTPAELDHLCPRHYVAMAPDHKDDAQPLFLPEEILSLKILAAMGQMRATSPQTRAAVEPWLQARIDDAKASELIREGARALLKGIREGQDDSHRPSVEQLLQRD